MLIEYLPIFLQEIRDYKEIMVAEEIEINKLKEKNNSIPSEASFLSASNKGLSRFEKILGTKTNTKLSLEDRKFLVRNKFLNRAPFTVKWLENKLDSLCGKGNYNISIDLKKLLLQVQIGYMFAEATEELRRDLRKIIPANISLDVNFWYIENVNTFNAIGIQQTEILTLKQMN